MCMLPQFLEGQKEIIAAREGDLDMIFGGPLIEKRHSSHDRSLNILSVISKTGVKSPCRQDETFHHVSVFLVVYSHRSTWPQT